MTLTTQNVLGISVACYASLDDLREHIVNQINSGGSIYQITFVNPSAYYFLRKCVGYREALNKIDMVLPDGIGVVVVARMLGGKEVRRYSFDTTSVAPVLFNLAGELKKSVMLVGGAEDVAKRAANVIRDSYNGIRICMTQHGFLGEKEMITMIEKENPDILICGMGVPRQELLLNALRSSAWKGVAITCGGYFDQCANGLHYYPPFIDKYNLRFLYRLFKEPRRLFKRYFYEYSYFVVPACWKLLVKVINKGFSL